MNLAINILIILGTYALLAAITIIWINRVFEKWSKKLTLKDILLMVTIAESLQNRGKNDDKTNHQSNQN